jgi:spore maturation protein CgeB
VKIVLFYHSLASDWNHGNAHFLRGVATELLARGHDVRIYEPRDGWSRANLIAGHGLAPVRAFQRAFPHLRSTLYDAERIDLDRALDGADLAIVHEWNEPELVARIGRAAARLPRARLLFHDTHHRSRTAPRKMRRYDLRDYDGVLAYGDVIRRLYLERGWAQRAWTWHEAADVAVFRPRIGRERKGDVVWIGNWGDGERTAELRRFLLRPARELGLSGSVFGVRYPREAKREVAESGLVYRGWIANYEVPVVFAEHAVTVHVPRRPYRRMLPGIPTIRPFEALACGVPLVSAPWDDVEGLFRPGEDFLVVRTARDMKRALRNVLRDRDLSRSLAQNGLRTIHERHTCAHRVDELLAICAELGLEVEERAAVEAVRR